MKFVAFTAAALFLAAPLVPANAQASASISVGMQVTDAAGAPVGTVKSVNGDNIVVQTDKHEVQLPKTSFTPAEGKLLFGMTQAQLNAEIEKSLAAADAAVVAGASVKGLNGAALGTIDTVDAATVTIALTSGKKVQVERNAVRGNPDGSVTIGITADKLEAQVNGSTGAAPSGK